MYYTYTGMLRKFSLEVIEVVFIGIFAEFIGYCRSSVVDVVVVVVVLVVAVVFLLL